MRAASISILKPLKGVDPGLRANLEAFIRQDYSTYELVFGVEDPQDQVISVVRSLMHDFPQAPLRLYIGASATGMNPKVNILSHIAQYARYDYFLISDADVRPGPDYLTALASELDEGVGLVHSALVGIGERSLGSILEGLHMNSFVAAARCGAHALKHSCVIGKSMLFKRQHLAGIGGFRSVENVLAEDYVLGKRFERAGFRVKLSMHPLPIVNPIRDVSGFLNRQLRWAQMRRRICPAAYLAEAFCNPIAWLILWTPWVIFASNQVGATLFWLGLAAIVVTKCLGDFALSRVLRGDFSAWRYLVWIPVKDILVAGVWLLGFFKRRVVWRGNVMWIGPESRLYANPIDLLPVRHVVRA